MRTETAMLVLILLATGGCIREERVISFQRDVRPILQANCLECHLPPDGRGYLESGLNLSSYKHLMRGTRYGPVIVPGDSRHSILNMLVEGRADPSLDMPHGRQPLGSGDIEILRLWVDHGAPDN